MAHIKERARTNKDGSVVRYFDAIIKRAGLIDYKSRSFPTKKEATDWAREIEAKLDAGQKTFSFKGKKTLVSGALDDYAREKKPSYNETLRLQQLKQDFENAAVGNLTWKKLEAWIEEQKTRPVSQPENRKKYHPCYNGKNQRLLSPASIRQNYFTLKKVLEWHAKINDYLLPQFLFQLDNIPAAWEKSTTIALVAAVCKARNRKCYGTAIAGKAASGLEDSGLTEVANCQKMLSELDKGAKGRGGIRLQQGDVLVVDEAGMLDTTIAGKLTNYAKKANAKIIQIGDYEQIQAIGAGGVFKYLCDKNGFSELKEVRRQENMAEAQAGLDISAGEAEKAIALYKEQGRYFVAGSMAEAARMVAKNFVETKTDYNDKFAIADTGVRPSFSIGSGKPPDRLSDVSLVSVTPIASAVSAASKTTFLGP